MPLSEKAGMHVRSGSNFRTGMAQEDMKANTSATELD